MKKTTKKKIKINGMHCSSCVMNIDFDLEDIKGVKSAKTNYARQETEVEFEPNSVNVELILQAIKKLGYDATLI